MKTMTLEKIKKALEKDTIKLIGNAEADNYGTCGDIRYQQEAILDGQKIIIYYDTTAEYDEWNMQCQRILILRDKDYRSELTDEEQEEYDELCEIDPENNLHYCNDESNNCDWNDPVDFRIVD